MSRFPSFPKHASYEADGGDYLFHFAYDPEAVDAIKAIEPWQFRRWDPDEKAWRIDDAILPDVIDALEALGYEVEEE